MSKRIICTVLSILLLLGSMTIFAEPASGGLETVEKELSLLSDLGFIDEEFVTAETVTRAQFVDIVGKMLGVNPSSRPKETSFKDVSPLSPYAASIEYAVGLGLISGTADNTFRPGREIMFHEAVKILVGALGYSEMAQFNGGYPTGYLYIAQQYGVLKGISADEFTKPAIVRILYNTLHAPMLKQVSFGLESEYVSDEEVTLLSEYHDIYLLEGLFSETEHTDLTGTSIAPKGCVVIDGVTCRVAKDFEQYLGYAVEAYVRQTGDEDPTVVNMYPHSRNEVVTVDADDIEKTLTTEELFVYYLDREKNDKTDELDIPVDVDLIYNGQAYPSFTKEDLTIDSGSVTLISYDGDDEVDVIRVTSYEIAVVESISQRGGFILNKYTYDEDLKQVNFELLSNAFILNVYKDGNEIGVENLKPFDVIMVAKPKDGAKEMLTIEVISDRKTVTVEEIFTDAGEVVADGEVYELSHVYMEALAANDPFAQQMVPGQTGTVYLDKDGKIAAYQKSFDSTMQYGYLRKSMKKSRVDDTAMLRILKTDGTWETFETADTVDIKENGEYLYLDGVPLTAQMIRYRLNSEGKVSRIETAITSTVPTEEFTVESHSNISFRARNNSFDSTIYIDKTTVGFLIPEEAEYQDDEAGYFVGNAGMCFSEGPVYSIDAYNTDKFGLAECVASRRPYKDIGSRGLGDLFIYTHSTTGLADGEEATFLYGALAGNSAASAPLADDCNEVTLTPGDILWLSVNGKGEIYNIEHKFHADGWESARSNLSNAVLHSAESLIYGTVEAIEPSTERMLVNDGVLPLKSIKIEQSNINMYIYTERTEKLTRGTLEDIEIGNVVFMRYHWSKPLEVIVYRAQ